MSGSRSEYSGMAIGVLELDSYLDCFVALDQAAKTADVRIQSVERNRLKSGACIKMRGGISDVKAAMETAIRVAKDRGAVVTASTVIAAPTEDTEVAISMTINK